MPIEIVFALVAFTFGGSSLVGFWAGRARRREDRLRDKARGWWTGWSDATYGRRSIDHNPYCRELERKRNAR